MPSNLTCQSTPQKHNYFLRKVHHFQTGMKLIQVESSFPRKSMTFFAVNMLGTCIQLEEEKSVLADLKALLLKMTGSVSGKLMSIYLFKYFLLSIFLFLSLVRTPIIWMLKILLLISLLFRFFFFFCIS